MQNSSQIPSFDFHPWFGHQPATESSTTPTGGPPLLPRQLANTHVQPASKQPQPPFVHALPKGIQTTTQPPMSPRSFKKSFLMIAMG
ncbi:Uncharacterized protein TCM_028369 [Theobroma cacao]|uniref:Uncharacterized protein n=1 Tax=Theobroma cacao TaxID=3641 RepID=A0A061GHN9_THECC|nr:Uncharacterized protein TCM_028369 [Theobroma cacao]